MNGMLKLAAWSSGLLSTARTLPTMSLRASPEHHQLIRDIATALRTRPELADVLQPVIDRLTRAELFFGAPDEHDHEHR
jgi:hypothetical protein